MRPDRYFDKHMKEFKIPFHYADNADKEAYEFQNAFREKYPDRMIDVGIAEEHAATMAAGMAAGGMRPYFAVYSSFFQRCYDQMIHDVCNQSKKKGMMAKEPYTAL